MRVNLDNLSEPQLDLQSACLITQRVRASFHISNQTMSCLNHFWAGLPLLQANASVQGAGILIWASPAVLLAWNTYFVSVVKSLK